MQKFLGLWLPDEEVTIQSILQKEGQPYIDGKPTYQYRKYKAAKKHMTQFRHAIDIGAHVGLWSRVMVRDFKWVTGFEPIPQHRECWEANMQGVKNCVLQPYALGAKHECVRLKNKPLNSGTTYVTTDVEDTIDAEMRTLDSFGCVGVDFIKIDCEGYERKVIEGAERTIRNQRPVMVVEQKEATKDRYGMPFQSAIALLESWGMTRGIEFGGDHIMFWAE